MLNTDTQYALLNKTTGKYYCNVGSTPELAPHFWSESKNPPQYAMRPTKAMGANLLKQVKNDIKESLEYYAIPSNLVGIVPNKIDRIRNADMRLVRITKTLEVAEV